MAKFQINTINTFGNINYFNCNYKFWRQISKSLAIQILFPALDSNFTRQKVLELFNFKIDKLLFSSRWLDWALHQLRSSWWCPRRYAAGTWAPVGLWWWAGPWPAPPWRPTNCPFHGRCKACTCTGPGSLTSPFRREVSRSWGRQRWVSRIGQRFACLWSTWWTGTADWPLRGIVQRPTSGAEGTGSSEWTLHEPELRTNKTFFLKKWTATLNWIKVYIRLRCRRMPVEDRRCRWWSRRCRGRGHRRAAD